MDLRDEHAQRYENRGSIMLVWRPAPGILVTRAHGHGTLAATRYYISLAQVAIVEFGRLRVFHDWSDMRGYDPEARDALRAFGKTNSDDRVLVHYMVSSKIMSMAIQTAGLVLRRNFASTTDRPTFEGWVDAAIESAADGPRPSRPAPRPH